MGLVEYGDYTWKTPCMNITVSITTDAYKLTIWIYSKNSPISGRVYYTISYSIKIIQELISENIEKYDKRSNNPEI